MLFIPLMSNTQQPSSPNSWVQEWLCPMQRTFGTGLCALAWRIAVTQGCRNVLVCCNAAKAAGSQLLKLEGIVTLSMYVASLHARLSICTHHAAAPTTVTESTLQCGHSSAR